jgi:hypothetical protein
MLMRQPSLQMFRGYATPSATALDPNGTPFQINRAVKKINFKTRTQVIFLKLLGSSLNYALTIQSSYCPYKPRETVLFKLWVKRRPHNSARIIHKAA